MSETSTYKTRLKELKCLVVIPTYNNAGTLAKVISDVGRYAEDILVVNDGSTDDTMQILSSIEGIRILSYQDNKGKGNAIRMAIDQAYEWGYEYILTIDSDGQHYADDIAVFVERAEQAPGTLLIGARNLQADNMPSKNTFANRFSNFWFKVETWQTLSDTQSGYRLYPLAKLAGTRFVTRRYEFEVEVIVRAAWKGIKVENVPIKVFYAPKEERVSHFRPLKDFTRISILNTFLVLGALLYYYPLKFFRSLTAENIRKFIDKYILHSKESNLRLAASMGYGVFCGIIPIWGYQMIFAGFSSHFLKLNKVIAVLFSNISIAPLIPFILFGSMYFGALALGIDSVIQLEGISFETVWTTLGQYVIGAFILAAVAGVVAFLISWFLMTVFKRKPSNE